MNHSLVTADRTTHLKIVAVSLVAAIAVILVGVTARVTDTGASGGLVSRGVGDFDGNHVSDILWREAATNHVEAWLLSNT